MIARNVLTFGLLLFGVASPAHAQNLTALPPFVIHQDLRMVLEDGVGIGEGAVGSDRLPHMSLATQENEPPPMAGWNKALRFALEVSALGAMGWWGYEQTDGNGR